MKRVLATLCPSCGAQVGFASGDSVLVVCPYCSSTLLRKGDVVENLGRMAELFNDHSPLQLGVQGRIFGRGFGLIGRLQVRYPAGTWNEWRLLYDDGSTGWLSEDNGQLVLLDDGLTPERAAAVAREARWPAFDALKLDAPFAVEGVVWRVVNKESATVIAGEGELPYRIGAGVPVRVADLRGPAGEFATLDYPEPEASASGSGATGSAVAAPTLYRGRSIRLVDLNANGLRSELTRTVATEAFACPACGAPVNVSLPTTKSLTCPACQVVLDLSQGTGERIAHWQQQGKAPKPLLRLQSIGRFDNVAWTVVGYQRRSTKVDGQVFRWSEYLLHEPMHGFRFLVHDRGHWSWVTVLQRSITRIRDARNRGVVMVDSQRFDQFSSYESKADWVMGEFYWQIQAGDTSSHEDYIAPPRMLSCEMTANEITWSEGRYLTPAEVGQAFGLKKPPDEPKGLGTIQPAPPSMRRAYLIMALVVMLALVLVQGVLWYRGANLELLTSRTVQAGELAWQDHLIDVQGSHDANLVIQARAPVTNQSVDFDVEVASRNPAPSLAGGAVEPQRWSGSMDLAFYEGRDSDGYWSEGSRSDRVVFKVPPGPYLVRIRAGQPVPSADQRSLAVNYSIAQRSRPGWLMFILGLIVLGIINLIGVFGSRSPEHERWADSDYGTRPGRAAMT